MDCSDCDSSALDSPNSSWSIARLKEYLRGKKRPSKRGKAEPLERDYLHRHRHLDSLFVFFFFLLLFFLVSFSFFFLSCLLCPILLIYRNAARQVLLSFFCNLNMSLKSEVCLNALCVSANIACWPLDRRRIVHRRNLLRLRCNLSRSASFPQRVVSSVGQRGSTARFLSGPCLSLLRSQPALISPLETGARRLAGAKKTPMVLHLLPGSD